MFRNVLIALDGSALSERSIPWVRVLAGDAKVHLVRAIEPAYTGDLHLAGVLRELEERAGEYLEGVASGFDPRGKIVVRQGSAAPVILDVAEEVSADLIALTTRGGSSLYRRVFGGTTEKLIHASEVPLLVVPPVEGQSVPTRIERLLVPLDGSEVSEMILPIARQVASEQKSDIIVVHVEVPGLGRMPESRLREVVSSLQLAGLKAETAVGQGDPRSEILRLVRETGANIVVMASHGYGAFQRMLLGSTASNVIRESPVPVLALRYAALRRCAGRIETE